MPTGALQRMRPDRRQVLVRCAAEEFAEAGYERASLNRIIGRVGMSKSSFYHVIESKRDLFELVVAELGADLAAAIEIPNPDEFGGGRFWERVEGLFYKIGEVSARDSTVTAFGRMFYTSANAESIVEAFAAIEAWLDRVLRIGRETGQVRDDLPIELQRSVIFAVLRALDEWTLAHAHELEPAEIPELIASQLATVRRLLAPSV